MSWAAYRWRRLLPIPAQRAIATTIETIWTTRLRNGNIISVPAMPLGAMIIKAKRVGISRLCSHRNSPATPSVTHSKPVVAWSQRYAVRRLTITPTVHPPATPEGNTGRMYPGNFELEKLKKTIGTTIHASANVRVLVGIV